MSIKKRLRYYGTRLVTSVGRIIRNRIFYYSQLVNIKSFRQLFCFIATPVYFKLFTPIHALSKLRYGLRTPQYALLFSRNNIAPFLIYNDIDRKHILTGGVPFFDKYFGKSESCEKHLFFIEHPYLEERILGWDNDFHERLAKSLEKFAIQHDLMIYIKLHPRSSINNWKRYNLNVDHITIYQFEEVTGIMLSANLILGYSSTLLNAMIGCRKNIVLLGWHPNPQIFGDDISLSGLCHKSMYMEELFEKYYFWKSHNLIYNNSDKYNSYIHEYNEPFDGKATERLFHAIETL
jgi:hypothetical protein